MLRGWILKTNTFLGASLEISRMMMLTLVGDGSTETGSRIMESSIFRLTFIHSEYIIRVPLLHKYIIIGFRLKTEVYYLNYIIKQLKLFPEEKEIRTARTNADFIRLIIKNEKKLPR